MRRRKARGLMLIAGGLLALTIVGLLATAVDLGRIYVVSSEIQAYADSAARAAAGELDGTPSGIERARNRVAGNSGRWKLAAAVLGAAETEFAPSALGPWNATADPAQPSRFIKVRAAATVPLLFLPAIGAAAYRIVRADAIAGRDQGEDSLVTPVARRSAAPLTGLDAREP